MVSNSVRLSRDDGHIGFGVENRLDPSMLYLVANHSFLYAKLNWSAGFYCDPESSQLLLGERIGVGQVHDYRQFARFIRQQEPSDI